MKSEEIIAVRWYGAFLRRNPEQFGDKHTYVSFVSSEYIKFAEILFIVLTHIIEQGLNF